MKGNNGVKFFLVIIIIGILTWIAWSGPEILGYKIPGARDITLGTDIKGGVQASLQATNTEGGQPTDDDLDSAKQKIVTRLDSQGLTDKVVTVDYDKDRVIVEIPWKSNEKDFNPQKTINDAIKPALLTFREVDETKKDEKTGDYLPLDDKIIIEGKHVVSAKPEINQQTGGYEVALELNPEGAKLFSEATGRLVGKPIAIFMDTQMISAPTVNGKIDGGKASITLGSTTDKNAQREEAKQLAATIRAGGLPVKLETIYVNSISPSLGTNALNVSLYAGATALVIVWMFMLLFYRLPGILANIALLAHTVLQLLAISWLHLTNLTLPGIAGVILTIGMGVDANIIIFERIKEELRSGKTLRAAIDVGFKRAFTAVLDANITTLLAAIALWMFGTGPLKGFAYTLGLGVILSFVTAVTASRILLKSVADIDIAKHKWLYGVSAKDVKEVKA